MEEDMARLYFYEDKLKTQIMGNWLITNRLGRDVIWNHKNIKYITGKLTTSNKLLHYAFDKVTSL